MLFPTTYPISADILVFKVFFFLAPAILARSVQSPFLSLIVVIIVYSFPALLIATAYGAPFFFFFPSPEINEKKKKVSPNKNLTNLACWIVWTFYMLVWSHLIRSVMHSTRLLHQKHQHTFWNHSEWEILQLDCTLCRDLNSAFFFFSAFTRITCILFTKIGKQAHLGRGYTGVTSNRILKSTTPLNLMGVTLCCRIWVVEPGGRLPADLLHNSRVSSVIRS